MMTHEQVEQQDIVERYARDRLAPDERLAFEEHFFECDACFVEVQRADELASAVRDLAQRGVLAASPPKRAAWRPVGPWRWSASLAAASLAVATGTAALWLEARRALERERATSADLDQRTRAASAALGAERDRRAAVERQMAQLSAPEPDVAVAVLQSTRGPDDAIPTLRLTADSARFILWIPLAPEPRFASFRVRVSRADGGSILTVNGLHRNESGAIVASLPAAQFSAGPHVVQLDGVRGAQPVLLGEYFLSVRRPPPSPVP
jgi:hypothetical protein